MSTKAHQMPTTSKRVCLVTMILLAAGGCPQIGQDPFSGKRQPQWLDGSWILDYTNSPNPTQLTFTDGKVTSELAGGVEPVAVLWATRATIDGNQVRWSYSCQQVLFTVQGALAVNGVLDFSGTIQDDGSIAGTATVSGTMNGLPVTNVVGFIMRRL